MIVAILRVHQALALANQASVEADPAERAALLRRSWVVLLAQALPLLHKRMDKSTLLPGKLRKAEEAYTVYEQHTVGAC